MTESPARSASSGPAGVPYDFTAPPADCPDCGWPDGSFACKIRHQHMNTGACKAAND